MPSLNSGLCPPNLSQKVPLSHKLLFSGVFVMVEQEITISLLTQSLESSRGIYPELTVP